MGIALLALGLCGLANLAPALADFAYPLCWWGLLPLLDLWNERRRGLSLWRGQALRFFGILAPLSALFWLFFELLNLPTPQWRYRGGIYGVPFQALYGFVAFATVIPIVMECWWICGGAFRVPGGLARVAQRRRWLWLFAAVALAALPFFNHVWWWNQAMWVVPALALLPFTALKAEARGSRFALTMTGAGLLSGFLWECLNYRAATHWEYLIMTAAPHLFRMPLAGYIGFVPFAFTALVVYEWSLGLKPGLLMSAILYGVTLAGLCLLTVEYLRRGLWLRG